MLVLDGRIISKNKSFRGALAVRDGDIIEIGPSKEIKNRYKAKKTIEAEGKIVMPGLVDGHVHNAQIMLRGSFSDKLLTLPPIWLNYLIPYESFLKPEDVKKCSLLTQLGLIKSGITSFVEAGGPYPDKIAEATAQSGLRGGISKSTIDVEPDTPMYQETDEIVEDYRELIENWDGKSDGKIKVWISLREIMLNSIELYEKLFRLSEKHDCQITMHLAESRTEVDYSLEKFGKRPVELIYEKNFLNERVLASHMIFVGDSEMEMLRKSGANVVWCPEVDAQLMGPPRVNDMLERNVNVIFGTDGGAWNRLDLFEQGRQGRSSVKMLNNSLYHDKSGLKYHQAFEMLTNNGSSVLKEPVGRIEEGYKADLIILDPKHNLVPSYDPTYTVVNMADSSNVETVIVDGKILMEEKEIKTLNEERIIGESKDLEEKLEDKIEDLKEDFK